MASGGVDSGDGATTSPQFYLCYQCNLTISLSPSPSSDLVCPHCNGGFLEEVDNPNPNPNPNFSLFSNPQLLNNPFFSSDHASPPFSPFLLSPSSSPLPVDPIDLSTIFGGPPTGGGRFPFQETDVFNPLQFLQTYLQNMGPGPGGANFQFVFENADHGGGGVRLPSNLGDYFFGPGLEQLIQQLAENDPNRYGTPPAAKAAVDGLPSISVTEELLESDSSQCAVCMDDFELGGLARQMPCKHVYHPHCILPWLELHNSCPVCRYELPTDDPDYEHRAPGDPLSAGGGGGGAGLAVAMGGNGGGGSMESSENDRTVERRFRISLPWPFRGSESIAETSNTSGGGNGNDNSAGETNSRNPGFESETRQEDLD